MQKDTYKHLGKEPIYNVQIELTMEELARRICSRNYGAHRFLSALVDELRERAGETKSSLGATSSPLADGIEPLLEKYFY